MATITLNSIKRKAPVKKHNVVEITVYLDGQEYWMAYSIPMSGSIIGSQKNKAGIENMFHQALTDKFGRVDKI